MCHLWHIPFSFGLFYYLCRKNYLRKKLIETLYTDAWSFEDLALETYTYQSIHNPIYNQYLTLSGQIKKPVSKVEDIPFLPISFFKSHEIKTGKWSTSSVFTSSGTTGAIPSIHHVRDKALYLDNAQRIFEDQYGSLAEFHLFALLPGYLERANSSLVAMAEDFIAKTKSPLSGFYLHDFEALKNVLAQVKETNRKTLLLGVSFGLMDFAEAYPIDISHSLIMETGGMKGRRKEIIREELHQFLKDAFGVPTIHSEYGMTELFSQAYSKGGGIYTPGRSMRILLREMNDPFSSVPFGKTGLINVIDLGNIDSCSFIATDDIGRVFPNQKFEVLGRYDQSDVRGCNLMVSDL